MENLNIIMNETQKEQFESPEAEVIVFGTGDVIEASPISYDGETDSSGY